MDSMTTVTHANANYEVKMIYELNIMRNMAECDGFERR